MAHTRTAFLSSTGADLTEYREKAHQAINSLQGWKCVRMEDFGARDWDVDSFCKRKVGDCDLFIGIVGHRFGSNPSGSKESYTQREYAASEGKPRLMFVAWDKHAVPADLREEDWKHDAQVKFRALVRSEDRLRAPDFKEPMELANQILKGIRDLEQELPEGDPTKYLEALHQDTANIEIRGFQTGQKEGYRFPIADLYTPLTAVQLSQNAVPLQEARRIGNIVIVGDPGSGKTTFLRRIAFACCQTLLGHEPKAATELFDAEECPFPIMISAASLAEFIATKRKLPQAPAGIDAPEWVPFYLNWTHPELSDVFFANKLDREGALLMLDGLDEAPNPQARLGLAVLVKRAAAQFTKTRIVVTSRPAAYGGETNIDHFAKVEIGPLDKSAIKIFLDNWCRLLYTDDEASSRQHLAELQQAIDSRPEIARPCFTDCPDEARIGMLIFAPNAAWSCWRNWPSPCTHRRTANAWRSNTSTPRKPSRNVTVTFRRKNGSELRNRSLRRKNYTAES